MGLYLQSVHEGERYLIPTDNVIEVVPYVKPRMVPHAPEYVVGMIDYRGDTLPLVDMCVLLSNKSCKVALCSRILIGESWSKKGKAYRIGWLLDGVTETVRVDDDEFKSDPVNLKDTPYLGDVATDDKGIMQRIKLQNVLPEEAYEILFSHD